MGSDSATTQAQKQRIATDLQLTYGLTLPQWIIAGAYSKDLKRLRDLVEEAWTRYRSEVNATETPETDRDADPDR